ncbi:unnamed protein product [Brachionus calyciflorus]|uniref:Uncharacterized protein n=1 Tax=Brachionus calyciflorus TaxID=104777 RepID=A0A814MBQ3_9BILA|nr:unnamed protein product [Brachionus calyciflorus]
MSLSRIETLANLKESCAIYSVLVAFPDDKSKLINAETVEGLITHLKNTPCMLSFWDEASKFFGSFGLKKVGDADRHSNFIKYVLNEQNNNDDSLIQRFNICAQKPVFLKTDEILNRPEKRYSLSVLFYTIYRLNDVPFAYVLDENANNTFYPYTTDLKNIQIHFILMTPSLGNN